MPDVAPIPPDYGSITPYLIVPECSKALAFYAQVFGAIERFRMPSPDGSIGHAEIAIGGRVIMCGDTNPQFPPTRTMLCLYVEDCDAVFERAVAAGATVVEPVSDKFYGDRAGTVTDPFGQIWSIMTHKEDVSPDEMNARMAKLGLAG